MNTMEFGLALRNKNVLPIEMSQQSAPDFSAKNHSLQLQNRLCGEKTM